MVEVDLSNRCECESTTHGECELCACDPCPACGGRTVPADEMSNEKAGRICIEGCAPNFILHDGTTYVTVDDQGVPVAGGDA